MENETDGKIDPPMRVTGEDHEKAIAMCESKPDCPHHQELKDQLKTSYIALLKAEIAGLKERMKL
tara:strand:- start:1160 stop:1354 length:195 start_codon:yes stop_codon:yes gene_type:complete